MKKKMIDSIVTFRKVSADTVIPLRPFHLTFLIYLAVI